MAVSQTSDPTDSLDPLRRDAQLLQRAWIARTPEAVRRVTEALPQKRGDLVRADFLHVIAQERGFANWPLLKAQAGREGLPRAEAQQRLKIALAQGHIGTVAELLAAMPDLVEGLFGIECALYDVEAVRRALSDDPAMARGVYGPRTAFQHLAFSRWITARPDLGADMLAVAEALQGAGADIHAPLLTPEGPVTPLAATLAAGNRALTDWLLRQGAKPDGAAILRAIESGPQALVPLLSRDTLAAIPALHHAARHDAPEAVVTLLLDAGADPQMPWQGITPYAYARALGHPPLVQALEARGHARPLTPAESLLAGAAEGHAPKGLYIDPNALPPACATLLHTLAARPDRLPQMRALVTLGLFYDAPDAQGVTPVQVAGHVGMAEVMAWLLSLRPDRSHVNAHGGTLLTAILRGAEGDAQHPQADHRACLQQVLEAGVALPRRALATGRADLRAFLADWAAARPGQVV